MCPSPKNFYCTVFRYTPVQIHGKLRPMLRYHFLFQSVHTSTPAAPTIAPTPNAYSISGQPVAREPPAPATVVCMNGFVVVAVVVTPAAAGNSSQVVAESKL
jgi:hypothetical protein